MTINPRKRFLEDKVAAKALHDAVATAWFQAGAEAAMLSYQASMGNSENSGSAAAFALKLQGAKGFLDTLMTLTEPDVPTPQRKTHDNLHPV